MRALAVAALALAVGCAPSLPASYHCTSDAQCVFGGQAGRCEATGACSFPDATCAGGRRYGSLDPAGLAGMCVADGADLGMGGGGGGGSDGGGSAGNITRVGTTTLGSGTRSSIALPVPSGIVAGDFVFVSIFLPSPQPTITPPAGWTQHADLKGAVGGEFHAAWYFHVAADGEPATWTFTLSAQTNGATAAAVAYRGVDDTAPIDTAAQQQFEATTFAAPSLTTTHANDMLVAMFVQAGGSGVNWTGPSGMQTAVDDGAIGIFDAVQANPGASGTRTAGAPAGIPNVGAVDFVALTPQ
jgi:hypothetical protein